MTSRQTLPILLAPIVFGCLWAAVSWVTGLPALHALTVACLLFLGLSSLLRTTR